MESMLDYNQQKNIDSKIKKLVKLVIKKYSEFNNGIDKKYDNDQLEEILIGLFKGLDISKYASHKFNWTQMTAIRIGLEQGLDVDRYAKPNLSWLGMCVIKYNLQAEKENNNKLLEEKNNNNSQNKDNKFEVKLNDKKVLISNNNDSITIEIK